MKPRTLVALLIIETVILHSCCLEKGQVQITLSGEEQPTAYYILPYKTLKEEN